MTNEIKLSKYLKAIKTLLQLQNKETRLIDVTMSQFVKTHKLSPSFFTALGRKDIIHIKKGAYNKRYFYAKMYPNQIDPKHAKDVIEICNKISASYTKKPKIIDNSVIAKLAKFNKFVNNNKLESTRVKIYRNKNNHSDTFDSIDEAIKRNLFLGDYETHYMIDSPKERAIKMISLNSTVTANTIKVLQDALVSVKRISKVTPKHGVVITNGRKKRVVNPGKKEFQAELNRLYQRILAAKGNNLKSAQLRLERVQYYIDNKKVPSRTFGDFQLYNDTITNISV